MIILCSQIRFEHFEFKLKIMVWVWICWKNMELIELPKLRYYIWPFKIWRKLLKCNSFINMLNVSEFQNAQRDDAHHEFYRRHRFLKIVWRASLLTVKFRIPMSGFKFVVFVSIFWFWFWFKFLNFIDYVDCFSSL